MRFLHDVVLRPVAMPAGASFQAVGLALGRGSSPLEVLVATSAATPMATTLRTAWKARNAGRAAAVEALGPLADQVEIEDTQLLRRLIARRCVYGVDLNPTAVQLARLSIWIHTFVPGLPLSLLDHNLVRGNSLVGIGRLEEAEEKMRKAACRSTRWMRSTSWAPPPST